MRLKSSLWTVRVCRFCSTHRVILTTDRLWLLLKFSVLVGTPIRHMLHKAKCKCNHDYYAGHEKVFETKNTGDVPPTYGEHFIKSPNRLQHTFLAYCPKANDSFNFWIFHNASHAVAASKFSSILSSFYLAKCLYELTSFPNGWIDQTCCVTYWKDQQQGIIAAK